MTASIELLQSTILGFPFVVRVPNGVVAGEEYVAMGYANSKSAALAAAEAHVVRVNRGWRIGAITIARRRAA